MPPLLRIAAVSKVYPAGVRQRERIQVLERVDAEVASGEILVVVGANGAGKTTLLKIAASLTLPDSGTVEVDGESVHGRPRARRRVGFASGDERMLFPRLTALENLRFFAALYALTPAAAAARIE